MDKILDYLYELILNQTHLYKSRVRKIQYCAIKIDIEQIYIFCCNLSITILLFHKIISLFSRDLRFNHY